MKRIKGLSGPTPGLTRYCAAEGLDATWNGLGSFEEGAAKSELADALVQAQHGLCAYCEIALVPEERQVEHFVPRSDPGQGKALALAHGNLLVCCRGGSNRNWAPDAGNRPEYYLPPVREHLSCGEAKGSKPATGFLDPRQVPAAPALFRVARDGTLAPDADACVAAGVDPVRAERHIAGLGLNVARLRNRRAAVFAALAASIDDLLVVSADDSLVREFARRSLLPNDSGGLAPFHTVARSVFGPVAERILEAASDTWV